MGDGSARAVWMGVAACCFTAGCQKPSASNGPTMADTSHMMAPPPPPTGDHHDGKKAKPPGPVEKAVTALERGQVRYEGPDTMVVNVTAPVSVKLAKGATFAKGPSPAHKHVLTAPTGIGDSARVCLQADAGDFRITPDNCPTQVLTRDTTNVWRWLVTPLQAGTRLLDVRVEALLTGMPGKVVFDSSYTVIVAVAPETLVHRVGRLLTTWQGILGAVAAIVASLAAMSRDARALVTGLFKGPARDST